MCECTKYFGFKLKTDEKAEEVFNLESRWSKRSWVKVTWHLVLFFASGFAFFYTFSQSSEPAKYLIYLTNWSLLTAFVTFSWQLVESVKRISIFRKYKGDRNGLSGSEEGLLILWNILGPIATLITLFYWPFVYAKLSPESKAYDVLDKVLGHGLIPLLVLTDLALFSHKRLTRWQHFYQPLAFGLCYVMFSLFYYLLGLKGYKRHGSKSHLYAALNWAKVPNTLMWCIGMGMGISALHFMICALNFGFYRFSRPKCGPSSDSSPMESRPLNRIA